MKQLLINIVFQRSGTEIIERLIYISNEKDMAFSVKLTGDTSVPKYYRLSDLEEDFENGNLIICADPYDMQMNESLLTLKSIEQRDKHWDIINYYWQKNREEILFKQSRKILIEEIASTNNMTIRMVRRLLTRFFQRGMNRNSMLPDYVNSGRGKRHGDKSEKLGRKRNALLDHEVTIGINVDETIRSYFKKGIETVYNTKIQKTLKETYRWILTTYFSERVIGEDGIYYRLFDEEKIPTYRQFDYWYRNYYKKENGVLKKRIGERKYESDFRELLSDSNVDSYGPGARYQIDATIADVYLVSSFNRNRIIGRPIVYIVIDVYSRLITGLYVGLEGPSWLGAMMALNNVVENKKKFCDKYDIKIRSDEWPDSYLPESIIADRGEFEGYNVEHLINNLNVKIENTPPYRGDLKGIVERKFRTINTKLKHETPGAIQKEYRKRGDKDYRLDARLSLREVTKIIILEVINHNNRVIDKYPMENELLRDEIVPTPANIWRWGLINKRCGLNNRDSETVRVNLLPRGNASISRKGIRFKKAYYSSEKAIKEQWFINPERKFIEIVYDPRNMSKLYILKNNGHITQTEECFLMEKSDKYTDVSVEEMIFMNELESELRRGNSLTELEQRINKDSEIREIIKKSKNNFPNSSKSDKRRIENIKSNRAFEKETIRLNEAGSVGKEGEDPQNPKEVEKRNTKVDYLKKKREEMRGK